MNRLQSRAWCCCLGLTVDTDPVHGGEEFHTVGCLKTLDEFTHAVHSRNGERMLAQESISFSHGIGKQLNVGIRLLTVSITTDKMSFDPLQYLIKVCCVRTVEPSLES